MRNLVILLVVLFLLYLIVKWFIKTPPKNVIAQSKKTGLYAVAAILLLLVVTGRINGLFAILAGALPFAQRLFTAWRTLNYFRRFTSGFTSNRSNSKNTTSPGTNQSSTIETERFRMFLDHETGELSGTVLSGKYNGEQLDQLSLEQLLELLRDCHASVDSESSAVLESFLDRYHNIEGKENWREIYGRDTSSNNTDFNSATDTTTMTAKEAYMILGLTPQADKSQVKDAHRKLMQKYHPDRGGSTYLSAKINQAKDCLMNITDNK